MVFETHLERRVRFRVRVRFDKQTDNNTVEMVSKTHLERRVLGLVLGLTNIHTLHFTDDNNANTV